MEAASSAAAAAAEVASCSVTVSVEAASCEAAASAEFCELTGRRLRRGGEFGGGGLSRSCELPRRRLGGGGELLGGRLGGGGEFGGRALRGKRELAGDRIGGGGELRGGGLELLDGRLGGDGEFRGGRGGGDRELAGDGLGGGGELRGGALDGGGERQGGDLGGGRQLRGGFFRARSELRGRRFAGGGELLRDVAGRFGELRRDGVALRPNALHRHRRTGVEAHDQLVVAAREVADHRLADGAEALIHFADAGDDFLGALGADFREARRDVGSERVQGLVHLRALGGDFLDARRSGAIDRGGDIVRRDVERAGDALADIGKAFAEPFGNALEVGGDALMGVADDGTHPAAAGDDRLALVGHFGDQRANAALIVGIGALQRRNLGAHQRLELGGARKGALDAVAHRSDLAADGLGQRRDLLAGDGLRLGETQGDLRDRAGRDPEFLEPARERRETEQEERRPERGEGEQHRLRAQRIVARGREVPSRRAQPNDFVAKAQPEPEDRRRGGGEEGRVARAARLHGLQNGADRRAVVIGRRRLGAETGARLFRRCARPAREGRRLGSLRRRRRQRRRLGRQARRRDEQRLAGRRGGRVGSRRRRRRRGRRGPVVVGGEVQSVLDRRHRRGNRVLSRLLLRHLSALTQTLAQGCSPSRRASTARRLWPRVAIF